jgi:hypothetical protein
MTSRNRRSTIMFADNASLYDVVPAVHRTRVETKKKAAYRVAA